MVHVLILVCLKYSLYCYCSLLPFSDILRTQTGFEDLKSTLCKLKPHQIGKIQYYVQFCVCVCVCLCVRVCVHVNWFEYVSMFKLTPHHIDKIQDCSCVWVCVCVYDWILYLDGGKHFWCMFCCINDE